MANELGADVVAIGVSPRMVELVATSNSEQHPEELWRLVDVDRITSSFSLENGESALRRHFATRLGEPGRRVGDIRRHRGRP
jgi:hypothetical protein